MGEAGTGAARQRFQALDGWRGLCAVMIVFLHAPIEGRLAEAGIVRHSFLFVDFFFVLSGFVIAHGFAEALQRDRKVGQFLLSRFRRVYPLHLFMLAFFVAFELAMLLARGPENAFLGGNSPGALVHNLLMTHSLGFVDRLGWNYPSWSISAELVAYGVFAAIMLFAARYTLIVFPAIALVAVIVIATQIGHIETMVEFGWLRCLLGFGIGATLRLHVWPRAGSLPASGTRTAWTLAEVATLAFVLVFVAGAGRGLVSLAAPLVFAFAIFVFAHEGGTVSRVLKTRPVAFLGLVSYSIYMTHAFVISRAINVATVAEGRLGFPLLVERADGAKVFAYGDAGALVALAVILAGTLVFSALTWRFVERPGQRLSFRSLRSVRVRPAGDAATGA